MVLSVISKRASVLRSCGSPTRAARRHSVRRRDLRLLLRIDEAFVRQALHQFVEQILNFLVVRGIGAIRAVCASSSLIASFGEQVAFLQRAQNGFAQRFHGALADRFRRCRRIAIRSRFAGKNRPGA